MNNYQLNRYKMFCLLTSYLEENKEILKDLPCFKENYSTFLKMTEEIRKSNMEQLTYTKKEALEKKQRRNILTEELLETSRKLTIYARLNQDSELLANCRLTPWSISRLTHLNLNTKARIILDMAGEHIGKLAQYGITAETLKHLKEATDAFLDKISEPRMNAAMSVTATKNMERAFVEGNNALRNIDLVAEIVRKSQGDFYIGYRSNRKQLKAGEVKMALKAQATDQKTGRPVAHATFTFNLLKSNKRKVKKNFRIVKKTKKLGGFKIMHMPAGEYEVVVNKPGYKETRRNFALEDSVLVRLKVEMEAME